MDINDIRGLATVLAMVAFLAVTYWAYSSRRKKDFEEAANLPFADDNFPDNGNNTQNSLNTGNAGKNKKGGGTQ
ncbi:CcoQ/FixQ family Cbb3-type cytochrome c oxidase assembly chaperone [Endozoicomonas montiporae]|uniref:Cytochrome c oxidase, cbb3-type subunit IV n=1 Tax=Endozoicomonas montiporae CL-33 TaxID=570277 RepID=A0A142BEX5_9GAMM|nr:CcoQ/FixQ family Cbb3-type cytochrome c oxidase assembly chaperone [Endozoicomonas montiporae]AMO57301.1 cytochrome c oxidase, cbb3-type subunit IV [Endozoicomonas montiporae CL-33]